MPTEILNAKITSTSLGMEDHGIMTCYLHLEGDGWGCAFGGYALDTWDEKRKRRVGVAAGMDALMTLMEILEIGRWEDLAGQYVRCETHGWRGKITKIGHLIKNRWFSFDEYFMNAKEHEETVDENNA